MWLKSENILENIIFLCLNLMYFCCMQNRKLKQSTVLIFNRPPTADLHRRSQGGKRSHAPPKFLENIVILCFKRRVPQQNSVIRLKSNILPTQFLTPTKFLG